MNKNFLVIDKKVLPEVFQKVMETKKILNQGKAKGITEATKISGISRSVYYKYKDYVFEFSEILKGRKATFSMIIKDKQGVLSNILNYISEEDANIITIDQGIPRNYYANLNITIDISNMKKEFKVFLEELATIEYVEKIDFIAME